LVNPRTIDMEVFIERNKFCDKNVDLELAKESSNDMEHVTVHTVAFP